jgi:hypothetical protein
MRINGGRTCDATYDVALFPVLVTFVECKAVGDILDRITVEIGFELIHAFRMVARRRDGAENGVANIDDKHGARLATEYVQIRDIEADILSGDG